MTQRRAHVLRIERTFEAPAEDVFDAWTSEEVLRRWFHGMPGWETPIASVDLRVGGTVRVLMRNPEDGAEYGATGEYRVVDRPRRLEMTWVFDDDRENVQLIELEFTERDGRTSVVMFNSGIGADRQRDEQESGWHRCFDNLDRALAMRA
jgi:uncharacterized protein YndB with AHSA1/START domain